MTPKTLEWLTADDVLRIGACREGVEKWVARNAPGATALPVGVALRISSDDDLAWIEYAAGLTGDGDGCGYGRLGFGFDHIGYGFDGDGFGCYDGCGGYGFGFGRIGYGSSYGSSYGFDDGHGDGGGGSDGFDDDGYGVDWRDMEWYGA